MEFSEIQREFLWSSNFPDLNVFVRTKVWASIGSCWQNILVTIKGIITLSVKFVGIIIFFSMVLPSKKRCLMHVVLI